LQDDRTADLERVASRIVASVASGRAASPDETRFLLREYIATGREEVRDALGVALAQALAAAHRDAATRQRAALLTLFVEASPVADDERVLIAAGDLVTALRGDWPSDLARVGLAAATASVEACLRASGLFDPSQIVPPAIDELERIVAGTYRPGEGLSVRRADASARLAGGRGDDERAAAGQASDHVAAASALLTAFEITGRLPYSMLAEELMQRRTEDCETARVLCRLAALHDNPDYRAAAIVAPGADYRADAARMLADCGAQASDAGPDEAARYGIALRELMSLR
jgi:hypothetical protein